MITVLFMLCFSSIAMAQSQEKREYVGKAEATREAGMVFWRLVNQAGEEVELLGAPYEFEEKNKKASACIENAVENDKQIRITGIWKKDGNVMLLDAATAICQPINSAKDCPDKVVGTKTLTGVYNGVECGDFCYILLKISDNKDFSGYADEDEVEKLFGNKQGKKVSATFEMRQMWTNEGGPEDDRPDAPGWCSVEPVFKTGKVISK